VTTPPDPATTRRSRSATIETIAEAMIRVEGGPIQLRDEGTRRTWEVELSPFLISAVPLTRAHARSLLGELSAADAGPQTPVTEVSWIDCVRLCNQLSEAAGLRPVYAGIREPDAEEVERDPCADGYRLPTEAEWEHACRAGSAEVRYGELDEIAWHAGNSGDAIHDVATRRPNSWGLYDMLGNAWEWCWDVFDPRIYGPYRVFRGGGFADLARGCRASCRRKSHPTLRIEDIGLRLARSIVAEL